MEATPKKVSARQPLSVSGKVAFWAFLVGTILTTVLVTLLTIFSGSPSQNSVVGLVCWVVCTVLIVSGVRWMQALSLPVGAYLLYRALTEPFVIQSLSEPKGSSGGFGHFVGVIWICTCAIIAFAASVATVWQNYRSQGSRQMPRWLRSGLGVIAGMALGAILIGALSEPVAPTGLTYTNGVPTIHMDAGSFLQSSVTITKGSQLLLVDDSSAVHILANGSWQNGQAKVEREPGAPVVNNKQVSSSSVEIGPFTVAGTYHIYCLVHPGMTLTVIVQ